MTTSSEDVLLQMSEVRFKKGDGTLYVMNERLAWMAENRDTVAVSHRFQDIKMQKISPEGKPKVQLQVVLHDGNSSTFHFVNPNGSASQISDRDKVKELLQQLLPNFKRKVDKELEEKNKLLSDNPTLLQLYKDLVITQVITSEEFWTTHARHYAQATNVTKKQDIGVSGAFLADIKPQTDGCNGLKYNLTSDIIDCIFKTYPAVKRKHIEHVPSKYTESEFWTKFFQSHYFHRDRINAGSKDMFTECGKIDDQLLKVAVEKCSGDPLLDLRSFNDNPLDECYGAVESDKIVNSGNIVHQSMIKRFNQHSIMVLKTCTPDEVQEPPTNETTKDIANMDTDQVNSTTNGYKKKHKSSNKIIPIESNSITLSPKTKKARILEKISYDDLIDVNTKDKSLPQLQLTKIERYLYGPVPHNPNTEEADDPQELNVVQDQIVQDTEMWSARTPHKVLVSATSAVNALGELSPGGALMRGFQEQSLAQLVPPEIEKELKNLYLSLLELLRHFWRAFPPTSTELETTAIRMHEALQRYQMVILKPFEDRVMRELSPLGSTLTQHLNQLLQTAFRKFLTWQERKIRSHR